MNIEQGNFSLEHIEIETNSKKVLMAYKLGKELHKNQTRNSGEPYFNHCIDVYKIIKDEWDIDNEDIQTAGLLHDTVEDTDIKIERIRNQFGQEVGELVYGVTKNYDNTDKQTLEKVFNTSYVNPGVSVLKLADRLSNMRTLEFMPREKQIKKAKETLEIHTKLAESLGLWEVKTELEDLCFKYLYPEEYIKTVQEIDNDLRLDEKFICHVKSSIEQILNDNNVKSSVEVKRSGYWFLRQKKEKAALKGVGSYDTYKSINDLLSIKVKLDSVDDCYKTVGDIHSFFGDKVDFDRYDEFFHSNKRINGYQALQTTINFEKGPVEIAIATKEMWEFNNWGVVSLINNKKDLKDYVLKLVFTPNGNIRFLPKTATGVDFAASINKRVLAEGNTINVNGVESPLSMIIPNASTVRVNFDKPRRAPLEGIEDYASPKTRKQIQELRIQSERDNFVKVGQETLESVLKDRGLLIVSDVGWNLLNPILYNLGCQGVDDLYFMVGSNSINLEKISKELDLAKITKEDLGITSIRIKGPDQPRVLVDLLLLISDINKNIVKIDQTNFGETFNVRILVKDMTKEEEKLIQEFLENDSRFSEGLIV